MKVHDIQQYFSDLARLMQSTDARKTAAGLEQIARGLEPFRGHDLEAFAGFLKRAEEYDRTGKLPVVIKATAGTRTGSPPRQISDISAIREEVKLLYSRAGSAGAEEIEAISKTLQPLKKDELVAIAQAIELVGVERKTKADILNQVVSRIRSIQQSAVRTAIIERPGTAI